MPKVLIPSTEFTATPTTHRSIAANSGADWAGWRADASGTRLYDLEIESYNKDGAGVGGAIKRAFLAFDTARLTGKNVIAARLSLKPLSAREDEAGMGSLYVVPGTQSYPLANAEFGNHVNQSTPLADIVAVADIIDAVDDGLPFYTTLNADGRALINGGTALFCLRAASDVLNTPPTIATPRLVNTIELESHHTPGTGDNFRLPSEHVALVIDGATDTTISVHASVIGGHWLEVEHDGAACEWPQLTFGIQDANWPLYYFGFDWSDPYTGFGAEETVSHTFTGLLPGHYYRIVARLKDITLSLLPYEDWSVDELARTLHTGEVPGAADHKFWWKGQRERLVIPNHITVTSPEDVVSPRYTGQATYNDSFLRRPVQRLIYLDVVSDAEAEAIAEAALESFKLDSESGSGRAPMNTVQEVWDYVQILDIRDGDSWWSYEDNGPVDPTPFPISGNVQVITRVYDPLSGDFTTDIYFGKDSVIEGRLAALWNNMLTIQRQAEMRDNLGRIPGLTTTDWNTWAKKQ